MKIVLYGAGNYCDKFLELQQQKNLEIISIVDGNCEKWGQIKNGYEISSPEKLKSIQYERLIITAYKYDSILTDIRKIGLSVEKIYIYDGENNIVVSTNKMQSLYLEQKVFRKHAVKQIKISLMAEAFNEKEFEGYSRIIVFGGKEECDFLQEFFGIVLPELCVVQYSKKIDLKMEDKCILCDSDYREQLKKNRNKFYSNKQWIIIPLFDVQDTIVL